MTADHLWGFVAGWACAVVAATAYLMWLHRKDES